MKEKPDVLQGTLALMVLKTLDVLGPQHGWGIARRIEQISGDLLAVNQGTLYPLLLKLEHEGSISPPMGGAGKKHPRRALFFSLRARMLPTEARRQAALKFGAAQAIREGHHAEHSLPFFENLLFDLRYALRM